MDWNNYDLIGFGEYVPNSLLAKTIKTVKKYYPYSVKVKYNIKSDRLLLAYSKYKISSLTKDLKWYPVDYTDKSIANNYIKEQKSIGQIRG